ncbi:MAG: ATP-binding cassette domain-containing protein, partial [Candidatus Fermentibacteria bacterium]
MKEAIRLENVTTGYRRGNPVIHDINLTVPDNDFLAVIGPNGGGKSTLLKVILGLLSPWEGTASVLGKSPVKTRPAIGYVPQLIPEQSFPITVMDVVLMGRLRNT